MICPNCGASVADGALRCPRCRFELGVTQKISLNEATWCPSCGALVAPGAEVCPKCGARVHPEVPSRPTRDLDLPEIGNTFETQALREGAVPDIESAIPSAEDGAASSRDRLPRTRVFVVAAVCAVLVVGGGTLLLAHPWDPGSSNISAKTPADTSKSGFPGTLQTLTGQDGHAQSDDSGAQGDDGAQGEQQDEQQEETLSSFHDRLGELSARADALEQDLSSVGVSGTADERSSKQQEMYALSIEVSNLIADLPNASDAQQDPESAQDLSSLASWLRNRCDALSKAWELSRDATDPSAESKGILAAAQAGASYASLFSEHFDSWSAPDGS